VRDLLNRFREAQSLENALAVLDHDARHRRAVHYLNRDDTLLFRRAVRQVNTAYIGGIDFFDHPPEAMRYRIGAALFERQGWRFVPSHKPARSSKRFYVTFQRSLPAWLAYPHVEMVARR
jgi:hypothetical protein